MKSLLFLAICLCFSGAKAQENGKVLIYSPESISTGYDSLGRPTSIKVIEQPKAVDANLFEQTIRDAIKVFENSMRKTCVKEMETSITVTAEGKWAVVGVSISGAMKLLILNPEISKKCDK